jgi:hypothetical protein
MMPLHQKASQKDPALATLFLSFLKLGFTSFGGPAMIAYIRRLAVEQKGWLDDSTFKDGVALCQSRIFEGIQEKVSKALMPRDAYYKAAIVQLLVDFHESWTHTRKMKKRISPKPPLFSYGQRRLSLIWDKDPVLVN